MSSIVGVLWLVVGLSFVPVVWHSMYSLARFRLGEHRAGLLHHATRSTATATGASTSSSTVADAMTLENVARNGGARVSLHRSSPSTVDRPSDTNLSRAIRSLGQMQVESPMLTLDQQSAAVLPIAMPTYQPNLIAATATTSATEVMPPLLSPFGSSLLPSVASSRWTTAPPRPYDGPPVHPDQRIPFSFGDQMPLRVRSMGSGPVP